MAVFNTVGVEELGLSMYQLMTMPESVIDEMLEVGAETVAEAQNEQLKSNLGSKTGVLASSPDYTKPRGSQMQSRYIDVYPQGTHHVYTAKSDSGTVKKKRYKQEKGKQVKATNAEVAFIHEYGAPGRNIKATQSMRIATEKAAPAVFSEQEKVYDNWLNSINLK